jgi:hypothetical protein
LIAEIACEATDGEGEGEVGGTGDGGDAGSGEGGLIGGAGVAEEGEFEEIGAVVAVRVGVREGVNA